MKTIKRLIRDMDCELEMAEHYAECYVEAKAFGDTAWARELHTMAEQELKHCETIHQRTVEVISTVRNVFKPTAEMEQHWDKEHSEYLKKHEWIENILKM